MSQSKFRSRSLRRVGVLAAVASVALVTGCFAQGAQSDAGADGSANELRVSVPTYPSSWDHDYVAFDVVAMSLMKNTYPFMLDYGIKDVGDSQIFDTANIIPTWAESFTTEDNLTWTLKIKDGAVFPSGNPITAEDVKWSKDRAFAANANVAGVYSLIGLTSPDQIEVVDDTTVTFTQLNPSALTEQIQAISLFVMDSKEAQEHATEDDPWAQDWFAQNPTSGGYFNVESVVPGQEVVMVANPDYAGDNPAQIERVRFEVIADPSAAALQLEQGDIDVALGLSSSQIADLEGKPGVKIINAPSNDYLAIPLNVSKAPFDNLQVRQAVANAIPYDQIIETVYQGNARRAESFVPIDTPGYDPNAFPYDYDLDAAKEHMAQSGVSDFSVELAYDAGSTSQERIAIIVSDALAEIGIDAVPTPLDPAVLGERREAKSLDMQIQAGQSWVDDVEYVSQITLSTGHFLNNSNYSNSVVDEAIKTAGTTVDLDERNELWKTIQTQFAADIPIIPLLQPDFQLPVRDNVSGFVNPVDGLLRYNTFTIE